MAVAKKLRIYLDDGIRSDVSLEKHNFFKILTEAFERNEFEVELCKNTGDERLKSVRRNGYSLFHLEDPFHKNALDVRLAYMYPFWRIENCKWREDYSVGLKTFEADDIDADEAKKFFNYWVRKTIPQNPEPLPKSDFVFIPLQGLLLDRRHGQVMSPVEMIKATLEHDHNRQILIKYHPGEKYSAPEKQAVADIARDPRICLTNADVHSLLDGCAYVVTQNSSVAFKGLLHRRPAVLFGRSDFHHVFQNVEKIGLEVAFGRVTNGDIPYDKFFYWFLQVNCINAGRPDAGEKIIKTCQAMGWEI